MKITEGQIGWLAGILDGEGNLQLSTNAKHLRALVNVVTNTNTRLIQEVSERLESLGISHRIQYLSGSSRWSDKWKPAWSVMVMKIDEIKKLLGILRPFMVGKREQCDILMEFLSRRESCKPTKYGAVPTTDHERLLAARMKELNRRGTSESVTTSTLPSLKSEMIQSELHGDMQRMAEMTIPESEKIQ